MINRPYNETDLEIATAILDDGCRVIEGAFIEETEMGLSPFNWKMVVAELFKSKGYDMVKVEIYQRGILSGVLTTDLFDFGASVQSYVNGGRKRGEEVTPGPRGFEIRPPAA